MNAKKVIGEKPNIKSLTRLTVEMSVIPNSMYSASFLNLYTCHSVNMLVKGFYMSLN